MISLSLRKVNPDGTDKCVLPGYRSLTATVIKSQQGGITLDYPLVGLNSSEIEDGIEVRLLLNGVERRNCRFLIEDHDTDEARMDENGTPISWTGRTYDSVLEFGLVYPTGFTLGDYFTSGSDPSAIFTNATAGEVMQLARDAQDRGCYPDLDLTSFTDTHDSEGNLWSEQISKSYTPGTKVSEVLQDLVALGLCHYYMDQRTLMLVDAASFGEDYSPDGPGQLALMRGRDLIESPNQGSVREVRTASLVQGSTHYVDDTDSTAVAASGRRETFVNNSTIDSETDLRRVAGLQIDALKNPITEKSHDLKFTDSTITTPLEKFNVGDWLLSNLGDGKVPEKHEVVQIVVGVDEQNTASASVVFDSLIDEEEVRTQRQLDAIANGTSLPGAVTTTGKVW